MREAPWLALVLSAVGIVGLLLVPYALSYSQKEILVFLVINVLVAASYRFLTLTGEWSLGHVVMMGAGAYASAILSKRFGVPVPVSMALGATVAAAIAWVAELSAVPDEGVLFPYWILRRWRSHPTPVEALSGSLRRPEGAEENPGGSRFRSLWPANRFFRTGDVLLLLPHRCCGFTLADVAPGAVTALALPSTPCTGATVWPPPWA